MNEYRQFHFFIPMRPQPLQRSRSCANGHHYTPQRTRDAKDRISEFVSYDLQKDGVTKPIEGFWDLDITVYFEKPKNWFPGKFPSSGGDWDNHGKTICDALNGVLWEDDRWIREGTVKKEYGDSIGYEIKAKVHPITQKPVKKRQKNT